MHTNNHYQNYINIIDYTGPGVHEDRRPSRWEGRSSSGAWGHDILTTVSCTRNKERHQEGGAGPHTNIKGLPVTSTVSLSIYRCDICHGYEERSQNLLQGLNSDIWPTKLYYDLTKVTVHSINSELSLVVALLGDRYK